MTLLLSRRVALGTAVGATLSRWAGVSVARPAALPATMSLEADGGRIVTVSVWRAARSRGTILFSHGALSSPAKYTALIEPWVAAGFDVFAPLHVDSTDHPQTKAFPGLASWKARLEDMAALAARVAAPHPIAAGHSYGALVALTLGGAGADQPPGYFGPMADRRVRAVIAFSPPGITPGLVSERGYATLACPALIQTGTADIPPPGMGGADGWRAHLAAYDAVPVGGDRYALVLDGADHYFGGMICRPELPGPKQAAQFAQALEISALFLDAYGRNSAPARRVLAARTGHRGMAALSRK